MHVHAGSTEAGHKDSDHHCAGGVCGGFSAPANLLPDGESMMDKVNRIWNHPMYREAYAAIQELEKEREFCGHSAEHFLAVARLMWIYNLEEGSGLSRERVYGAALLHDIGRHLQYRGGDSPPRGQRSAGGENSPGLRFCGGGDSGYSGSDPCPPLAGDPGRKKSLRGYLYRADKQSRSCLSCLAEAACDWPEEKKNLKIDY